MITRKDFSRLTSLVIVSFTVAFVCSLFLNYLLDLTEFKKTFFDEMILMELNSRETMARFTFMLTFIMLGVTTIFLIISAVNTFIDEHQPVMGMLKAMGYSNLKIAMDFYKFGLAIFMGLLLGYLSSMTIAPVFYDAFAGESHTNPPLTFQMMTVVYMVLIPTLVMIVISVLHAYRRLRKRPLEMIYHVSVIKASDKLATYQEKNKDNDYLKSISRVTIRRHRGKTLLVIFAGFCFAAMMQMPITLWNSGFSLIGAMIMVVSAVTLGCGILYITLNIVVNANRKAIAIMKMCGYSDHECNKVFLKPYKCYGYMGFIIGSIYQFLLVKMIMQFYEKSNPDFSFEVVFRFDGLLLIFILFFCYYHLLLVLCKRRMKKVSYDQLLKR